MIKDSYELPEQSLPGLPFSEHLADICAFRDLMERIGLRTKNTRIERYQQYLEAILNKDEFAKDKIFNGIESYSFNNPLDIKLYVLREVHELMWILRGFNKHMPKGASEKLSIIVAGRDFAALDSDSLSRNTQFELRIASYFCQKEYKVDLSTETDIIANKLNDVYFVECKRVASDKPILKRAKEAQQQLRERLPSNHFLCKKYYGIVAIDVTKAAFSHNGLTWGCTDEHTRDNIQSKLSEISKQIDGDKYFKGNKRQLILWLQIHIPALVMHPMQQITRFSSLFVVNHNLTGKSFKAFKRLQNVLQAGETGDIRESPPQKMHLRRFNKIPAGSTFYFDKELVEYFLSTWELDKRDPESIFATLQVNGVEHKFSFFEFENLIAGLDKGEQPQLREDVVRTGLEFIIRLYTQRYPYVEDDKSLSMPLVETADEIVTSNEVQGASS